MSRFRLFLDPRVLIASTIFSLFMCGIQAFLWLARGLLTLLARVGYHVEWGADAERDGVRRRPPRARVVASATYEAVGTRLAVLEAARQLAGSLQERWWQSQRLADDVPALVEAMETKLRAQPGTLEEIRRRPSSRRRDGSIPIPHFATGSKRCERRPSPPPSGSTPPPRFSSTISKGRRAATRRTSRVARLLRFLCRSLVVPVSELCTSSKAIAGDERPSDSPRVARLPRVASPSVAFDTTARLDVPRDLEEAARSVEAASTRAGTGPCGDRSARRLDEAREPPRPA